MVLAALVAVVRQLDLRLADARPWQIAAVTAAVVFNLLITAAIWWVITLSFDARPGVGMGRMLALICTSALLNYLPMRPGLLGRAAYLKIKHALPFRQSLVILLVVLVLGAVVLLASAVTVLSVSPSYQLAVGFAAALLASLATRPIARMLLGRRIVLGWLWVPLRVLDMLVGAVRLWLAFGIVGVDVPLSLALVAGAAGMLASLIGLTPNGLGLREWVIAALAGFLGEITTPIALAAALVDRAIEGIVVSIAGLVSLPTFRHIAGGSSPE